MVIENDIKVNKGKIISRIFLTLFVVLFIVNVVVFSNYAHKYINFKERNELYERRIAELESKIEQQKVYRLYLKNILSSLEKALDEKTLKMQSSKNLSNSLLNTKKINEIDRKYKTKNPTDIEDEREKFQNDLYKDVSEYRKMLFPDKK